MYKGQWTHQVGQQTGREPYGGSGISGRYELRKSKKSMKETLVHLATYFSVARTLQCTRNDSFLKCDVLVEFAPEVPYTSLLVGLDASGKHGGDSTTLSPTKVDQNGQRVL